jgi:hypothetical protein
MPEPEPDLLKRKQRWCEFFDLSSPRRVAFLVRYAPEIPPRPLPNPELRAERLEWIWRNYVYHLERMEWLDDDTLPCLDMLTGTELFAEAFGCQVYRPADNNPFALPLVHSAEEADRLQLPSLDAPPLALVFGMADELARRAGPGALFRLVDLQCPVDIAALIWEKTSFYISLVEEPEAVSRLVEKIKCLQFSFLDEWFRRYGRELVAHYPDYYLPQGVTLSVDEIGAISPNMFRQFFLTGLNEFSARYGGLGLHCCAYARHQWQNFKAISSLRLLNINSPHPETLRDAYTFFADFTAQWNIDQSPQLRPHIEWLPDIPPQAHVVLELNPGSRSEAQHLADQLRSKYG